MCPAEPVKKYSIKENVFSIVLSGNLPNYCGKNEKWMKNDAAQLVTLYKLFLTWKFYLL